MRLSRFPSTSQHRHPPRSITMSEGKTTIDHDEIREWAEERGGVPATVKGTGRGKGKAGETGILRLDFEPRDEELEEIGWDEFFEKFDKEKLAFLYQDETADGSTSRFHKFVNRGSTAKGASKAKGVGSERDSSEKDSSEKERSGKKDGGRKGSDKSAAKAASADKTERSSTAKTSGKSQTSGKSESGGKAKGGGAKKAASAKS
jgi:hypothetical protein